MELLLDQKDGTLYLLDGNYTGLFSSHSSKGTYQEYRNSWQTSMAHENYRFSEMMQEWDCQQLTRIVVIKSNQITTQFCDGVTQTISQCVVLCILHFMVFCSLWITTLPCPEYNTKPHLVPVLKLRKIWSHSFIAITPRSFLTWCGSTCSYSIYWSNISVWKLFELYRNTWKHNYGKTNDD